MSITEKKEYRIDLLPSGDMQIEETTCFFRDGKEISRSKPHNRVIDVEDDVSGETTEIQAIAQVVQTEERREVKREARRVALIAARKIEREAEEAALEAAATGE